MLFFIVLLIGLLIAYIIYYFNEQGNKKVVDEPDPDKEQKKKPDLTLVKRIIPFVVIIIAVILIAGGSVYSVSEQEQGVVTMFGKIVDIKTAGLYFRIPFIQEVQKVDTTTHGMAIGYTESDQKDINDENSYVEAEALMITSDFNLVDVDFYLEYRVSDPVKYLYAAKDPEAVLRSKAMASIRSTIVNYKVDDVITTGKSKIQAEIKDKLTKELTANEIGLEVMNISMQDAEPPTSEVSAAFKAVETAKQGADTAVNNANKYKNEQVPAAEASADAIIQKAEAAKASRIAEAEGQMERFNETYEQYKNYPYITKKRMFYETLESVLPKAKVIITDGSTQTLYPVESFSEVTEGYGSSTYSNYTTQNEEDVSAAETE
ncbi:MAG: FtsH protease activity modulator HflK [Lachnospiraceae bacterium]|nr:FtsH protease activity modulator HflK [Lachnospiraceae bacterium]